MSDFLSSNENIPEKGSSSRPRATFFGSVSHKVSERNQVAIPRHLMRVIQESGEGQLLLLRVSAEGYLRLYTQKQLDGKIDEIRNRAGLDPKTRGELVRHIARNAVPIEPDNQGRFVLPARWVEELGLRDEVTFCGAFSWIEIWPAPARADMDQIEQEAGAEARGLMEEILND